jgi:hypothetical protein
MSSDHTVSRQPRSAGICRFDLETLLAKMESLYRPRNGVATRIWSLRIITLLIDRLQRASSRSGLCLHGLFLIPDPDTGNDQCSVRPLRISIWRSRTAFIEKQLAVSIFIKLQQANYTVRPEISRNAAMAISQLSNPTIQASRRIQEHTIRHIARRSGSLAPAILQGTSASMVAAVWRRSSNFSITQRFCTPGTTAPVCNFYIATSPRRS